MFNDLYHSPSLLFWLIHHQNRERRKVSNNNSKLGTEPDLEIFSALKGKRLEEKKFNSYTKNG